MAVNVTEKAVKEIRRVVTEGKYPEQTMLRVGIAAGGCSGFQYKLDLVNETDAAKDEISDQHGMKIVVDKKSALYLDGATVDFYEGLEKRGFTFENPNVVKSCGCGSSFSA